MSLTGKWLGGGAVLLCWPWMPAVAQAGDEPPLDVIALPGEAPPRPGIRLNPQCGALILSQAKRYRPGQCQPDDDPTEPRQAEVIPLEPAGDSVAGETDRRP